MLVVIGRRGLDGEDSQVWNFVHLEIRTALERGVSVIPVLVDEARMPGVRDLPPELGGLTHTQPVTLRHSRFEADVRVLIQTLERLTGTSQRESPQAKPYRKIFASYSHKDIAIVRQYELFAETLGDRYLRDVRDLREGENWNDALFRLIDEADIFQLFWSTNSANSLFVRRELEYALSLNRPNFIRPTYWEDPLPLAENLPEEIRRLHFHRIQASASPSPEQSVEEPQSGRPEESAPPQPRTRRVYISHSPNDRAFVVDELVPLLERHGIQSWRETEQARLGVEHEIAITEGMESCDWFLLVMSPHSERSAWVQNEVAWAFEYRSRAIIPVLIADCDVSKFHLGLTHIAQLDYRRVTTETRRRLLAVFGVEFKDSPSPVATQQLQAPKERQSSAQKVLKPADKQLTFMVIGNNGTGKTRWQSVVFDYVDRGIHPQIQTGDGPTLRFNAPGGWFRRASSVQINLAELSGDLMGNLEEAGFRNALGSYNGVVFLVNPLQASQDFAGATSQAQGQSALPFRFSPTAKLKIPVAVCLSKIDLLRESPLVKETARWLRSVRENANEPANLQTLRTRSEPCEQILLNLVSPYLALGLRHNFSQMMYFPLTSLGLEAAASATSGSSSRTPEAFGVIEPILWLLEMNGYKALHGRPLWSPKS